MGSNFANELADSDLFPNLSLKEAITIHLRSNHYPPIPLDMVEPCINAIEAYNELDSEKLIELPNGITWRNRNSAPAYAIIEGHHLEAWLNNLEENE